MIYVAALIAMSPFVLAFAVLAKALRSKATPPMGTIGEEDPIGDDPGTDVDACPWANSEQQTCPGWAGGCSLPEHQ